jgi:hypothetical protein
MLPRRSERRHGIFAARRIATVMRALRHTRDDRERPRGGSIFRHAAFHIAARRVG